MIRSRRSWHSADALDTQSLHLDSDCEIEERIVDTAEGEKMVTLVVKTGAFAQSIDVGASSPSFSQLELKGLASERTPVESLTLVPYYYRSNRGGRGQMRVGFRPGELAL